MFLKVSLGADLFLKVSLGGSWDPINQHPFQSSHLQWRIIIEKFVPYLDVVLLLN